jgi:transcription antitermination factor NusG
VGANGRRKRLLCTPSIGTRCNCFSPQQLQCNSLDPVSLHVEGTERDITLAVASSLLPQSTIENTLLYAANSGFRGVECGAERELKAMRWYAVQTRSRHEKMVARQLEGQGFTTFLPLSNEVRQWSDRRKVVEMPLFPGYAFVRMVYQLEERMRVLTAEGVVNFVGVHGQGVPIPDKQIEDIQSLLTAKVPFESYPFLKVGQRVRIRSGSLNGTEGILVGQESDRRLVISVELIQRSVSIRLQGYEVEPIEGAS